MLDISGPVRRVPGLDVERYQPVDRLADELVAFVLEELLDASG